MRLRNNGQLSVEHLLPQCIESNWSASILINSGERVYF